jgi:superfamily II DNA helicase RecQ
VRVVVVSSAMGRGANFPKIAKVLFFHCPSSLEDLIQAGGRAGRDTTELAEVVVYYQKKDIPKNRSTLAIHRWIFCADDALQTRRGIKLF